MMKIDSLKERIVQWIQTCGPVKIGIMIVCGLLLLILSGVDFSKHVESEKTEKEVTSEMRETDELNAYRNLMETEVETLLSKVEGVGKAEVMLTFQASGEKVTLKDRVVETDKNTEESVLVEDENHNTYPYVVQEREPEIAGILVVCSGGDDPGLQRQIIDGISALFSVESHKIKVMKSKEAKE